MHALLRKRLLSCVRNTLPALLILSAWFVFAGGTAQAMTSTHTIQPASLFDPDAGREPLPRNDGWAAAEGGTSGGATASPAHVYTVTNREQLVQALGGDNTGADSTPKIIYIKGVI